ncbi:MAG: DUF4013 domain-containing protein [Chloroflexaceae bacterium]|jgi:hypothetical protein|nr:DUF4013 domain-containing protein [Chloroflexaceae bacterium]
MFRSALRNIHRDRDWWKKIGIGGALMLTIIGYPFAAGLVLESLDNSRKGYPTPLPPWFDWGTRYLLGIFALLLDFLFFALPLLVLGLLFLCASVATVVASLQDEALLRVVGMAFGLTAGGLLLAMWLGSVGPVARLMYVSEGRIEDALSGAVLRQALSARGLRRYWPARLASLVGYLPFAALVALLALLANMVFPGQGFVLLLLLWLALCALLYAHLLAVQLYVMAERKA